MSQPNDWQCLFGELARHYHAKEHNPKIFANQLNVQVCQSSDNGDLLTSFLGLSHPLGKECQTHLSDNCKIGEDCLKLFFRISEKSELLIRCFNIEGENLGEFNLGNIS